MLMPLFSYSATIILTSDEQLNALMDPYKKIDLSTGLNKRYGSLHEICEQGRKRGDKMLTVVFDGFFKQYRKQAGTERNLTPDMDEYIDKIKFINDYASKYGMGLQLSLLSPLEIGKGFIRETGQQGRWLHYQVGVRDPETGKFSVQLWKQLVWTNNKGTIPIKVKGIKAYAFKSKEIENTHYLSVNPSEIKELSDIHLEEYKGLKNKYDRAKRVRIYSDGNNEEKGLDKVLVMLEYETPEMDYFSPKALPFLKILMKKYYDKGINLKALYSDEMHIQQDWVYFGHHDNGQFCVRYYTPDMGKIYAEKYGTPFDDSRFLYFVCGPDLTSNNADANVNTQYVLGSSPEDIQRTFLMRHRYYELLNNGVVDLFNNAKHYAEKLYGRKLSTGAHASWAQSPTIDLWNTEKLSSYASKYEYTSNFIWSNTVHQASAACYDYFKWGEYLSPTGNDFAEGGWLDRDYYGAAMAASIGVINDFPNAYAACWGMPEVSRVRKRAINESFGDRASEPLGLITGHVHRDVDVLIIYPMELVAAEERFGSWLTQYGYANYITADKLLELAKITGDGHIRIKDKTYTTLVSLFEPLPSQGLLPFMKNFAYSGGKILWFGPPAMIDEGGKNCSDEWKTLFKVNYQYSVCQGEIAAGKIIEFKDRFKAVPTQTILTDFLVDRIYPIEPESTAKAVAEIDGRTVGAFSDYGKGLVCFFGFRPRDDQSASLGYETRTLFELLNAAGAYPPTGKFSDINDNTEYVSRNSDYLTTRFPNGATIVTRHYRRHVENWLGGFSRDKAVDSLVIKNNPLPSDKIMLQDFKVNGHKINYSGKLTMAFRLNGEGELIDFNGYQCSALYVDGKNYIFSKKPFTRFAFTSDNGSQIKRLYFEGEGEVKIPFAGINSSKIKIYTENGKMVKYNTGENCFMIDITPELSGKWLMVK